MTPEQQLDIISQAWGRQNGYCFFPWIEGDTDTKEERIQSYHEGVGYHWPQDRPEILEHMRRHVDDDLYWCPSLFEQSKRRIDQAMDEHCLWADLDEKDPRSIEDEYKPTVAWETSPNRYQALWLIQRGFDIQGASWAGGENQRLTAYLEADPSGWDTTQLLRIPGWKNHKFNYRKEGQPPTQGKLIWYDKSRRYLPDHFEDLPEVNSAEAHVKDVLEDEVGRVDRHVVWDRVRLRVNRTVREYMTARVVAGDRSEILWQMERELADAGCTVLEIVALIRPTVWNKYSGRADEFRRLTAEAAKAVDQRPEGIQQQLEAEAERPKPQRLASLLINIPQPVWLVEGIWTKGACGFIAGQPKSWKSWIALDLGLSIATGNPFLGHFRITNPGPVLYMQEEDGLPVLKQRIDKLWPGKQADRIKMDTEGEVIWEPGETMRDLAETPIDAYVGEGFTLSDPSWQGWLDDAMTEGEYAMVILDPFMMMAGQVDENRAQDMMTKIFRPLKMLAQKHDTSICLVHHLRKQAQGKDTERGGQLMLGSVANHAWSEDSLYIRHARGDLLVERESKHTTSGRFKLGHIRTKTWEPIVLEDHTDEDTAEATPQVRTAKTRRAPDKTRLPPGTKVLAALEDLGRGAHSTSAIARTMGITTNGAKRQLNRAQERGEVVKRSPQTWSLS